MKILPKYIIIFLLLLSPLNIIAQKDTGIKYISGNKLTLLGQSEMVSSESFHRIDAIDLTVLPKRIQELAKSSAGLNLMFQTNSEVIKVNWTLEDYRILWNMTPLAVNGLDLYGWNGTSWQYVASAKPTGINNAATFISNMAGEMRHYRVYLPLYTGLKKIKIGVEKNAIIKPADNAFLPSKKVVIYGSSITQGASASRPGMAYPSIVSRKLNIETINLGFSGWGKMEIEMAGIIGKMPADLYILDCVPNPSPEQIKIRAVPFIKKLRHLQPNVPILMVESIFREGGHWSTVIKEKVVHQNKAFRQAYQQLIKEGFEQLYYISSAELTGDDHGTTVDGTHLSDIGHRKIANRISQSIVQILQIESTSIK